MSDSVFDRLSQKHYEPLAKRQEEVEALDDYHSFGWLRGVRDRSVMLELRLRSGNIISLGYMWLERAEFDPSEGIILQFGAKEVRIIGRNLNHEQRPNVRLYAGLVRHRVPWIAECSFEDQSRLSRQETYIEEIRTNLR